ncbi:MAG: hypothetical protein R2821_07095 [Flavobacteriaceae bacterium]
MKSISMGLFCLALAARQSPQSKNQNQMEKLKENELPKNWHPHIRVIFGNEVVALWMYLLKPKKNGKSLLQCVFGGRKG